MKNEKYKTREEWLLAAVSLMRPFFKTKGYEIPVVRVSCGWPSVRGLCAKKPVIGEAWSKYAASDEVPQIFISPWLDKPEDPYGILPTLLHETIHATVGNENGHNKVFGKCARVMGLEGKLTETFAGAELLKQCKKWHAELGAINHVKLNPLMRPKKKQSTRLIKCQCTASEYNLRITRKWLEEYGAPISPVNNQSMKFEIPDDLDFDGEDENE